MAALGLVQFERYPEMLKKREGYVAIYNKAIDALNTYLDAEHQITYLDHKSDDHCSSHHLYLVRLQGCTRGETNKVIENMAERGIAPMKKLKQVFKGICRFCVYFFWLQKTDKTRYDN